MRRVLSSGLLSCGLVLLAACSHPSSSEAVIAGAGFSAPTAAPSPESSMPQAQSGPASGAASFLAYEHNVAVELPGADIAARLERTQRACIDAKFGDVHTVDECVAYLNSIKGETRAAAE